MARSAEAFEAIGIEHGPLIVVAHQHEWKARHEVDALAWIGAVADHVAEAINLRNVTRLNVGQDSLQGFQVTVDVADDRLHAVRSPNMEALYRTHYKLYQAQPEPYRKTARFTIWQSMRVESQRV